MNSLIDSLLCQYSFFSVFLLEVGLLTVVLLSYTLVMYSLSYLTKFIVKCVNKIKRA